MARSKPYTKKLLVLDILLTCLTHGGWLFVAIFRELWRHQ